MGTAQSIFEGILSGNRQKELEAYKILYKNLKGPAEKKIQSDLGSKISLTTKNEAINDIINETVTTLFNHTQTGKFALQGEDPDLVEKSFWSYVHRISHYKYLYVRKKLLADYELALFKDDIEGHADKEHDTDGLYETLTNEELHDKCFANLSIFCRAILVIDPSLKEREIISLLESNYPEMNIPQSGIRMRKSRCLKKYYGCIRGTY